MNWEEPGSNNMALPDLTLFHWLSLLLGSGVFYVSVSREWPLCVLLTDYGACVGD